MLAKKQICRIFEVMFSITHPSIDEPDEFEGEADEVEAVLGEDGDVENLSVTVACEEPLSLCEFAQRLEAAKFQLLAERDLLADEAQSDGVEVDIVAIEDISHTNLAFLPAAVGASEQPEEPIPARLTPTGIRIGSSN